MSNSKCLISGKKYLQDRKWRIDLCVISEVIGRYIIDTSWYFVLLLWQQMIMNVGSIYTHNIRDITQLTIFVICKGENLYAISFKICFPWIRVSFSNSTSITHLISIRICS